MPIGNATYSFVQPTGRQCILLQVATSDHEGKNVAPIPTSLSPGQRLPHKDLLFRSGVSMSFMMMEERLVEDTSPCTPHDCCDQYTGDQSMRKLGTAFMSSRHVGVESTHERHHKLYCPYLHCRGIVQDIALLLPVERVSDLIEVKSKSCWLDLRGNMKESVRKSIEVMSKSYWLDLRGNMKESVRKSIHAPAEPSSTVSV
jgi:hypothetical protein